MPTYDYHCTMCRRDFEATVSIAGRDWGVTCPRCGAVHIKRLPGAPAFKLVGKGFHSIDYPKGKR